MEFPPDTQARSGIQAVRTLGASVKLMSRCVLLKRFYHVVLQSVRVERSAWRGTPWPTRAVHAAEDPAC